MADHQPAPAHPHANHRERVRNLFLKSGLDGFSDHNVLELLLFYTIPQGDTNVTAHNLIDRFGSLNGVLNASPEDLCQVKGLGMYTATFLSILPQLARRYCRSAVSMEEGVDREEIRSFLCSRFVGEAEECVYLVALNNLGQRVGCVRVTAGTSSVIVFNERMILEAAFRMNASVFILAHNHPGGVAAPSAEDVKTTEAIAQMFDQCGMVLVDHIVVAGTESFSMEAHSRFRHIFHV